MPWSVASQVNVTDSFASSPENDVFEFAASSNLEILEISDLSS